MSFTPAVSLTTQIADHIGERIIAGDLSAEERIQELKIAKQLGVSRGSVREALLILESRRLVQIFPRRGALVSGLECHDVSDLTEISTELLVIFFQRLGRRLGDRGNGSRRDPRAPPPPDVRPLEEALQRAKLGADSGSVRAFTEARFEFLRAGLELLGSIYLGSMIVDLMPSWHRLAVISSRHPRADLQDNSRFMKALWEAVLGNDAERIQELVRAHVRREGKMAQEVLVAPQSNGDGGATAR